MTNPRYMQEAPPPGGFSPIRYKRHLPSRGPSALVLGLIFVGSIVNSEYRAFKGMREQYELNRELQWARHHLTPILKAEEDRQLVRYIQHSRKLEADVMHDEPGWEVGKSVYKSPAHAKMPPAIFIGQHEKLEQNPVRQF